MSSDTVSASAHLTVAGASVWRAVLKNEPENGRSSGSSRASTVDGSVLREETSRVARMEALADAKRLAQLTQAAAEAHKEAALKARESVGRLLRERVTASEKNDELIRMRQAIQEAQDATKMARMNDVNLTDGTRPSGFSVDLRDGSVSTGSDALDTESGHSVRLRGQDLRQAAQDLRSALENLDVNQSDAVNTAIDAILKYEQAAESTRNSMVDAQKRLDRESQSVAQDGDHLAQANGSVPETANQALTLAETLRKGVASTVASLAPTSAQDLLFNMSSGK